MIFIIAGNPIPKSRPRIIQNHSYDPQKKIANDFKVKLFIEKSRAFMENPLEAIDIVKSNAFFVKICFFMPIRKYLKKNEGDWHNIKPDSSNLYKFFEDCANGILWRDDAMIVAGSFKKIYSKNPRTEIEVLCLS